MGTIDTVQIGIFISIIILTIFVAILVNIFILRLIKKASEDIDNDPTNYQFLRRVLVTMIYMVGFSAAIYVLPQLRALASSILAGAGILAVAVGFASQQALSNIISGFFIIIFKPFRVNDRIGIRDKTGIIEDITLRHTVIRDFENKRIIIPNSIISDEVIVNSDFGNGEICKWIDIGISYDSDLLLAKKILREEVMAHPLLMDHRDAVQKEKGDEIVVVRVLGHGDSAINIRAWAWTKNQADAFVLSCDIYESIKLRVDREGIEIPFPHRTVIVKNSDAKNLLTTS